MAPSSPRYTTLLLVLSLLFFLCISHATRDAARSGSVQEQQHGEVEEEASFTAVEEKCGGAGGEGEDECLMRRTLVAHTDYIYTQGNHN